MPYKQIRDLLLKDCCGKKFKKILFKMQKNHFLDKSSALEIDKILAEISFLKNKILFLDSLLVTWKPNKGFLIFWDRHLDIEYIWGLFEEVFDQETEGFCLYPAIRFIKNRILIYNDKEATDNTCSVFYGERLKEIFKKASSLTVVLLKCLVVFKKSDNENYTIREIDSTDFIKKQLQKSDIYSEGSLTKEQNRVAELMFKNISAFEIPFPVEKREKKKETKLMFQQLINIFLLKLKK